MCERKKEDIVDKVCKHVLLCIALLLNYGLLCQGANKTLQIVWMVPLHAYPLEIFRYNASSSIAALAYGIETIKNESILPEYDLK
ncbi:hypothetical protein DPMN_168523 [Dreissena polymorpha]|uniref:Uncharacterized protein n=1 Tax=Dreissena polymorpha TaxID=45954 RepID=A0A9D4IXB4_DREPO|nr:hypothetical protein DPMN_168523 [Dreissena polymorpha]